MPRKPNCMYREIRGQAYTRREYMGGVPMNRISQFHMGNITMDFPVVLNMYAVEQCQIRHTALEAGRIVANKTLAKNLGSLNFHLHIKVYPHMVLRENKQATGAGADRVSMGMRLAFGKAVGTAARVHPGQCIMTCRVSKAGYLVAKDALRKAGMKLPTPIRIELVKGAEILKG